ncbi:hypothetical protein CK203_003279 [Vitis vinifera]|uniref:DUF4220 domain-containing protein n=1 Tax=Vitis vinifera TaxID=29760 RepID=A0A438K7H3_VITVI|nr:hypothetical protein CK203_003279 [Vitis vinifera]
MKNLSFGALHNPLPSLEIGCQANQRCKEENQRKKSNIQITSKDDFSGDEWLSFTFLGVMEASKLSKFYGCLLLDPWMSISYQVRAIGRWFKVRITLNGQYLELRVMVLLNVSLQIVRILFSKRRKYTNTPWIRILIWAAYLSADWVATVSLGTLSSSQEDSDDKFMDPNYTLMEFSAPFLLLHLGNPNTITAYSLKDNELLGLVVQVGVAFYVFPRSWAGTRLTFLSFPMFVAGIIKDNTKFNQVLRFFDMNKFLERYWYMKWEKVDDMKKPFFSLLLHMTNDAKDLRSLLKHRDLYSYSDEDPNPKARCKISKCLSEYMLYLLVMCPFMLPKGTWEFRFRDTCAEAKRFFQQKSEFISSKNEACKLLLQVNTKHEPGEVK